MRTFRHIEDDFVFNSAKERAKFYDKAREDELKLRKAKRIVEKVISIKVKRTKSWSKSEIDILLNNPLEVCLKLITTKKERFIISKYKAVKVKSKKVIALGKPLNLNYKNDYSNKPKHLPEVKCLNKKLIRFALRKT